MVTLLKVAAACHSWMPLLLAEESVRKFFQFHTDRASLVPTLRAGMPHTNAVTTSSSSTYTAKHFVGWKEKGVLWFKQFSLMKAYRQTVTELFWED